MAELRGSNPIRSSTQEGTRIMRSVNQPQQARSHASFSKVLSTTVSLLAEKGLSGVTIAEVSERASVSVGTIYGRVGNRSNLLRLVHERELARLQVSLESKLQKLQSDGENSVEGIVAVYVGEMVANAPIIKALIEMSADMSELSDAGPASWRDSRRSIALSLSKATDVDPGKCPKQWTEWLFEIMFATTVHHLERRDLETPATETFAQNLSATIRILMSAATPNSPFSAG